MGWENYHLFEFEVDEKSILLLDPTFPPEGRVELNARREIVAKHLTQKGQTICYTYDMGDNWRHTLTLEHIESIEQLGVHPVCLDGKRACPQEDSGGIWGHQRVLEEMLVPVHPEKDEMMAWLKEGYDLEYFDLKATNEELKTRGEKLVPKAYQTPLEDKKPVKLTKTVLRKQLKSKTREELSELLVSCFGVNKEVERYLAIAILGEEAIEPIYLEYRNKIQNVFFPSRRQEHFSLHPAKLAIRDFELIVGSGKYSTSLKLFFVEMGVEFTRTYGDIDARFYHELGEMYADVIKLINNDNTSEWWEELEERISAVVQNTDGLGWGFHDDLQYSYSHLRWI
jgi:hypothetical protein